MSFDTLEKELDEHLNRLENDKSDEKIDDLDRRIDKLDELSADDYVDEMGKIQEEFAQIVNNIIADVNEHHSFMVEALRSLNTETEMQ